jgi:ribosome-associated protein
MKKDRPTIRIHESELQEEFIRASGPGGQNVNKVASAVQLRFNVAHSSLPPAVRKRLRQLAGNRMTKEGMLIIEAGQHRSQQKNREEARQRLLNLIRRAAKKPKRRRKTKPTRSSQRRRLENKRRHSRKKQLRGKVRRSEY